MLSRYHDCFHRWNHGVLGTKISRVWYSRRLPCMHLSYAPSSHASSSPSVTTALHTRSR